MSTTSISKASPDRANTDKRLDEERRNSDQAIADQKAAVEADADRLVDRARDHADAGADMQTGFQNAGALSKGEGHHTTVWAPTSRHPVVNRGIGTEAYRARRTNSSESAHAD